VILCFSKQSVKQSVNQNKQGSWILCSHGGYLLLETLTTTLLENKKQFSSNIIVLFSIDVSKEKKKNKILRIHFIFQLIQTSMY